MTKQEIKTLIAAKIAGQGSAVDVGGALPVILNEILDLAGGGIPKYVINKNWVRSQAFNVRFMDIRGIWESVDVSQSVLLEVDGKVRALVPYLPDSVKTQLAGQISGEETLSVDNLLYVFGGHTNDDIDEDTELWVVGFWNDREYLFEVAI